MSKVVVSLSGGLDSAVLLSKLVAEGHYCVACHFQYGSKHNPYEMKAASAIAKHYSIPIYNFDLTDQMAQFKSNLLKGQGEIPEGHYEEDTMKETVVPGRNLIFLSFLAGLAESLEMENVAIAAHAGDHYIYPDCRPEFLEAAGNAIRFSTNDRVTLAAPFQWIAKGSIVAVGVRYDTPFHLTRTCYKDQEVACGKCGSCQERLSAFAESGFVDPIAYESRTLIPRSTRR